MFKLLVGFHEMDYGYVHLTSVMSRYAYNSKIISDFNECRQPSPF